MHTQLDTPCDTAPTTALPLSTSRLTVADAGEHALIERIRARLAPPAPWLIVPVGDDAAVVEPVRNELEVLTVDALVEGVHFDRTFVPPDAIGHRALAVNLSDLAAMGATPRLALLSLMMPDTWPLADFDAFLDGLFALAARFRITLVGGNVTRSPGPLVVDLTAVGSVRRRRVLTRGGGRAGDELYVSGRVGAAAAGLDALRLRAAAGTLAPWTVQGGADSDDPLRTCEERYLKPEPRIRLGSLLGRNRAASACMDLSDGLADAVRQITRASGTGALIDADALPLDGAAVGWCEMRHTDPLRMALQGGDDYELLFAVPSKARRRFGALRRLMSDLPLTRIGVLTADSGVKLRNPDGSLEELPAGYVHFR